VAESLDPLEDQLKRRRGGDFLSELAAASCSGEGVMWERLVLDLRSPALERLKRSLIGLLRALAWKIQS
jgi:hypothetical protein